MFLRLRPISLLQAMTLAALLGGCSAGSTAASQPGQVRASQTPFDATSMTSRYVDRCMKDGGTMGRCQCEAEDITKRLGEDGLARIVTGMTAGGDAALAAMRERQPSMTTCGWPNTKL